VEGVVAGVDGGRRSEDEMRTETRVQLPKGQMPLVVTQYRLAGARSWASAR
jgi:hypothetical protein